MVNNCFQKIQIAFELFDLIEDGIGIKMKAEKEKMFHDEFKKTFPSVEEAARHYDKLLLSAKWRSVANTNFEEKNKYRGVMKNAHGTWQINPEYFGTEKSHYLH